MTPLFQLLAACVLGLLLGIWIQGHNPTHAVIPVILALKALPTAFIRLIKMIVGLIIFCTLTTAIARIGDAKEMGRIGLLSLVYFEIVSTLALLFGQLLGNVFQPGLGVHFSGTLPTGNLPQAPMKEVTPIDFLLAIVPQTFLGALTQDNLLQTLLISLLFGSALLGLGDSAQHILALIDETTEAVFRIVGMIMKISPLAVFGAISYTVGLFGVEAFVPLGKLVGILYAGCIAFILLVFWPIACWSGFSLWKFILYIRDEIVLVYGTASSEAALPRMIDKLEHAGCSASTVGFVLPAGYSFNLVGCALYLTLGVLFIGQASNHPIPPATQWAIFGFFLLTSKGLAGVTASSFALLTTAVLTFHLADNWLALIFAVDRIMDSMRSITNLIGNGVSTLAIAKWVGERDDKRLHEALNA